jgi:choline transport protein
MGHYVGYAVNITSCAYIVVFVFIYCFPYSLPVAAGNMNHSCLITGGLTLFVYAWWLWRGGRYVGPQALVHEGVATGNVAGVEAGSEKW